MTGAQKSHEYEMTGAQEKKIDAYKVLKKFVSMS